MTLVTGGMGGLGSICSYLCAAEGMGPIITSSRSGFLPGGEAQLQMLEGIMNFCPHICVKGDVGNSNTVADLFTFFAKTGRTGKQMDQQVLNMDEINSNLRWQMGYSQKHQDSIRTTLELMMWVRGRYAKALTELRKKIEAGVESKEMKKADMEEMVNNLEGAELKVESLIQGISDTLSKTPGKVSAAVLKDLKQKTAQLSGAVADVEKMSVPGCPRTMLQSQDNVEKVQSSKGTAGTEWIVIGGGQNGGIIVQKGPDAMATELEERLATGAKVAEVEIQDNKLFYKKISGEGPEQGWVWTSVQGTPLLVEATETADE
mmetsp:Transcript_82336/g.150809  ORF Transcript_82336/g.150809 Transcript_82336/m.150809 type:complete len:318 (-) Transcript_82336:79-1032(-)